MRGEPVKYTYCTNLEWKSEKKGIIKSDDKIDINVACPPEFGGHPATWSPQDLFIASVELCMLTTFLWYIQKENINIKSYKSKAEGTAEMIDGFFKFSLIHIEMKIGISSDKDYKNIEKILKKVKRACMISNSINSEVIIDPEIIIS